jgi:hypothetical protein
MITPVKVRRDIKDLFKRYQIAGEIPGYEEARPIASEVNRYLKALRCPVDLENQDLVGKTANRLADLIIAKLKTQKERRQA